MKRLFLLACGIASALCLATMAQSQPLQYSRPATGGLLAQAPTAAPNPYLPLCLRVCDQDFAACHARTPNDAGCADRAHACQYKCRN